MKIDIFPDDTFITSYPKSGNTWARFFVSNLILNNDATDFVNLDYQVPDIYKINNQSLKLLSRPRFLKSHDPNTSEYPRVLYLVRDVRSVASSLYRQKLRVGTISHGFPMYEFTQAFVKGLVTPLFGSWDAHVSGWITNQMNNEDSFLLIRYEDMVTRGDEMFLKIASFLRLPRSKQDIQAAYMRSSFSRMRELEGKAGLRWMEKKPARGDLSIPFMYSGETNSWERDLDAASKKLLTSSFGGLLTQLGYEI